MMKLNQSGFIEGPYLLFLLFTTCLLLIHIYKVSHEYKRLSIHYKETLCIKEYLVDFKILVNRINRLNLALVSANTIQSIAILIPGGIGASLSTQKIKQLIKTTQEMIHSQFILNQQAKRINGCHPPLTFAQSPYQMQGIKLVRDWQDLTILRSIVKKGSWSTPMSQNLITIRLTSNISTQMMVEIL